MRWLPIVLLVAACAKSVIPEYEARKSAVLSPPREVPAGWQGDGALLLSTNLVDGLVTAGLDKSGALKRKVELGTMAHFTPNLAVTSLDLQPSTSCKTCVRISASLGGQCSWKLGASSGNRPLTGDIDFEGELQAVRSGESWALQLVPRKVNSAKLKLGGRTFRTVAKMADAAVQDWATQHIFDEIKPLTITRFEAKNLPLRAMRVVPEGDGIRVDLLTEAAKVDFIEPTPVGKGEDWSLTLSQGALLHVAKKAAFEQGVLGYDVAVEPTSLQVDRGTFVMGVRLWRLKGRGWWRDVRVTGTWTKTKAGFDFQAIEANEVDQSKGAALVDPLAALVEGRILHAVEDAVSRSVPGGLDSTVGGIRVQPLVSRVAPIRDQLSAGGTAVVTGGKVKPAGKPSPSGKGSNRK
ncbi:MAG: hypothetical protein AB8H79_00290 [Myxococcota bacterium]